MGVLFVFCLVFFCWWDFLSFVLLIEEDSQSTNLFQMPKTLFDLLVSFLTNDIAVSIEAPKKKPVKYNGKAQLCLMPAAMETFL